MVKLSPLPYDYNIISSAVVATIIYVQWETVRFLMCLFTEHQLIEFETDVSLNVWTIDNKKQELIDIMNDMN